MTTASYEVCQCGHHIVAHRQGMGWDGPQGCTFPQCPCTKFTAKSEEEKHGN